MMLFRLQIVRVGTLAFVLWLGAWSVGAQTEPPLVFILAGQSNMVGQGVTAELTADQLITPPNVTYLMETGETGLFDRARFGPEVTLVPRLAQAWPDRELIFVKHAVGGTSLLAWAPEWDAARAELTRNAEVGPLYTQLIAILDRHELRGDAEMGAVFWMQGESDARYPEVAAEYFNNLTTLIAAFRDDLQNTELLFVMGRANPSPERYTELPVVQRAQQRTGDELAAVRLIDTEGLSKREDGVHYDTAGLLELGRRFAAALAAEIHSP
jgi:hypothetical protein